MTKWGFTGSQIGASEELILKTLMDLPLEDNDLVITGACVGVDSQVFHLVRKHYPMIRHLIVWPSNRSKTDLTIWDECFLKDPKKIDHFKMRSNTTYRDRNDQIVLQSNKIIAFWTGSRTSGTYMTMNIAKRASKLHKVVRI